MSFWSDIFSPSGSQSYSDAQANYSRLQQQLLSQGKSLGANSGTLQDPGAGGISAGLNSLTFGVLGDAGNQADGGNSTGVGALLKDVLILAAIGGAVYLFIKLGGINQVKKLAGL